MHWSAITTLKELNRWALKEIFLYAQALTGRNLWSLTQGNTLWVHVMILKYFPNKSHVEWFRTMNKINAGTLVWKAFVAAFLLVET